MKFSFILASRERQDLLQRLCDSLEKTTSDTSLIEMLVGIDDDDDYNLCYPWLKLYKRQRGKSISVDYHNWLFEKSKGKYCFVLDDEYEMITKDWDLISWQKLESMPFSKMSYGLTNSSSKYSPSPIIGRAGAETLGWLMPPYYSGWTADVYVYEVYSKADLICNLREIDCVHHSHWVGKREKDKTSESMARMSKDATKYVDSYHDIEKLLGKKGILI